jgi:TonB family protein
VIERPAHDHRLPQSITLARAVLALAWLWAMAASAVESQVVAPTIQCPGPPRYPESEHASWTTGGVVLQLTIDATGRVMKVVVTQSLSAAFDASAVEAARQCAFTAATRDGQPVAATIEITVAFTPPAAKVEGDVTNERGEPLAKAVIHIGELAVESGDDGRFTAELPPARSASIAAVKEGYELSTSTEALVPGETKKLHFQLKPERQYFLNVRGNSWFPPPPEPDRTPAVSRFQITKADIDRTPGAMEDITRVVATLPGVVADPDLLATFFVRGGGPDEVIYYLDDVPLSNPYHLGGFASTFNPMLIDSADFWASGTPARYEPALSGVLDVHYDAGVVTKPHLMFDVSMESAKVRVDTPTGIEGLSATFAARRSYFELYFAGLKALHIVGQDYAAPELGEYFGRLNYKHGRHQITATYLRTTDGLSFLIKPGEQLLVNFEGGLVLQNLLQMGILQDRIDLGGSRELRFTAALTGESNLTSVTSQTSFSRDTRRLDGLLRGDLTLQFSRRRLSFTGQVSDTRAEAPWSTRPIVDSGEAELPIDPSSLRQIYAAYAELMFQPLPALSFDTGIRLQHEAQTALTVYSLRAGAALALPTQGTLKLAVGIATELPTDPLMLDPTYGNPKLLPERSKHVVLGLEQPLPFNALVRVEGWAKWLDQLPVNPDSAAGLEAILMRGEAPYQSVGTGFARGVDLMLLGQTERTSYGFSAGLLFADRTNPLATGNQTYPGPWDQRLTLSGNISVIPASNWMVTARATVHSGRPYTPITGFVPDASGKHNLPVFGDTNSDRYPWFYEASIRVQRRFKLGPVPMSWYVELLNLSNARNVFTYVYDNGDPVKGVAPSEGIFYHLPIRPFLGVSGEY